MNHGKITGDDGKRELVAAHVRAAQQGSQESFDFLMKTYGDATLQRALRKLNLGHTGRQPAEEIMQEVWFKVWKKIDTYHPDKPFTAWLYAVTDNQVRDWQRAHGRRREDPTFDLLNWDHPSADLSAEERLDRAQLRSELAAIIAKLPQVQREVMHLLYTDELSLAECAEVLGRSLGSVKMAHVRGKAALKKHAQALRPYRPQVGDYLIVEDQTTKTGEHGV